jgi:tRNA(fMet)-specific endonuclease VapC
MLYILDTDTVSHFRRYHPLVLARVRQARPATVSASAITVEEQIDGWYHRLKHARVPQDIEDHYRRLLATVVFFGKFPVIEYTVPAIQRFEMLKKAKLNIRANDMRIGAIALEAGATVVTANTRDFGRIPNLAVEDWTV